MRQANRQRIGRIGRRRFRQAEKRAHHERDLAFVGCAAADGRLFDPLRRIFENRQTALRRGEDGRTARRAQRDRRLVTLHVNDRFERATIRLVSRESNPPADQRIATQTGRGRQRAGVLNYDASKARGSLPIAVNYGDAGISQRSVDGQNAHELNLKIVNRLFKTESR